MNARRAGVVLGILSAISVLLVAIADVGRKSPGPVSTVHARIAELDGGNHCSSCHGGWFGDLRSSCNECHKDVAAQVQDHKGLHGTLAPALAGACGTCHGEHHGGEFKLVNRLAFAQAGIPDPQHFDHRRVGFVMAGRHTQLECSKCHQNADVAVLPEGGKRFLGLQQDCGTCHQDPHGGRMQVACAVCHSQETFVERDVAGHDRLLRIDGAHAEVGCRECHAAETDGALERIRPAASRNARQCGDCHQAPHSASFLDGNARLQKVAKATSCALCHPIDFPEFSDPRTTVDTEQHACGGFSLRAPHDHAACAQCHAPGVPFAERHPGRNAELCAQCHADPHGGQFATGPFAEKGCVGCHDHERFAPHAFDDAHHARTALPLDGKHGQAECAECHKDPVAGQPRQFAHTPARCEQCHEDVHAPVFASVAAELSKNPRGTCAGCHGADAFAQVDHAAFAHEHVTGFPVAGAHAQIECTDCHARTATADAQGRRFGRIERRSHGFAGCATCHPDPHAGMFDRDAMPNVIEGRTSCERCHDAASFRALPHGFDHAAFTGYGLVGAHAALDCAKCHATRSSPDATGRTWEHARGRECSDCHTDPHEQQFVRDGRIDCARCHRSATTFAVLSFRHDVDSRFPLGEAHAKVPCASCHPLESFGGRMSVRYLPLPTECVQCHGTEGAPKRRKRE
jgi:hypothetical protein